MSVSYGGDKITFEDGSTVGSGWAGFKNRIINGAMVFDQRNAGASVTPTDAYTLDRWELREDTDGAITCQRVADAPAGFTYSSKITTTTADASLSGTQRLFFRQPIEGYNVADLAWGTASASPVTLSFWVKSSLTGTFGGSLANSGTVRSYPFTYTIDQSNTWEYKTITIAGDTTGTWLTTDGAGINLFFGLGVGSDYSGTAGAWTTAARFSATGTTSVIGTLGATWQVTGVQLEKGSQATSFEYRPYGTELQLCQRYYEKSYTSEWFQLVLSSGTQIARQTVRYSVLKRAAATTLTVTKLSGVGTVSYAQGTSVNGFITAFGGSAGDYCEYSWSSSAEY